MVTSDILLKSIKQAAIAGGEVLMKYYKHDLTITAKSNIHDIVTQADKESQRAIVERLQSSLKGVPIGFIGEEENLHSKGEYLFIIDPLDGTNNFASGFENFCISIGVMRSNQIVAGLIFDVIKNDFYYAKKGEGAFRNDERLNLRKEIALESAVILVSFPSSSDLRTHSLQQLAALTHLTRTFRVHGAVAHDLCSIAAGVGDIVLNFRSNIWDLAAGYLIIHEAGGEMVDFQGRPLMFDNNKQKKYQIIAGEKKLLRKFLKGAEKFLVVLPEEERRG